MGNKQNKYPTYILRKLRQREDLDENDESMDKIFNEMSPDAVLSEVCMWEGLIGYGSTIKEWVEDIYGVDLDEVQWGVLNENCE